MEKRRITRQVQAGSLTIGSRAPVSVQSMINIATSDIGGCVIQALRIAAAGGELVRITAPGPKEAALLREIHRGVRDAGCGVPLSADIHYLPQAAEIAARYVEKVRINPGNFAEKSPGGEPPAPEEAARYLREKLVPFISLCRRYGRVIRIGTNHGSLSERILHRYGNTPEGMVEATLEYLRICREEGFDQVVVSLKSSDCRVMIRAVRQLVCRMDAEEMNFPLHLGVTEAGEGEDGRIRSAVGIGTLLNEGLGDTIRVSLTEEPEREIPVGRRLIALCPPAWRPGRPELTPCLTRPFVVADLSRVPLLDEGLTRRMDFQPHTTPDPVYGEQLEAGTRSPEFIFAEALGPELSKLPREVTVVVPEAILDIAHVYNRQAIPCVPVSRLKDVSYDRFVLEVTEAEQLNEALAQKLSRYPEAFLLVSPQNPGYSDYRRMLEQIEGLALGNKRIIRMILPDTDRETALLHCASQTGGLFVDRLADGIWIHAPSLPDPLFGLRAGQDILQTAGVKRYKTEFISCPGCGRTRFHLQEAVHLVKKHFSHLTRLKIAVMGCIVNGPGEMGDADYGYVGAGEGKVTLYRKGEPVYKQVPEGEAIDLLKQLIKESGDWQ